MILETLLAAIHILAILTLVVFISSAAALCRPEWLNGAALERLARVDLTYQLAAAAVLLSGLARSMWGIKGNEWYWGSPLLHLKLTLFVTVALLSLQPTLAIRRWLKAFRADGALPRVDAILRTRRQVMRLAHMIPVIAVVAVFMARGWWH